MQSIAIAQYLPLFTQYREYSSYINPGSINSDYYLYEYNLTSSISYRNNMVSIEDAPSNLFSKIEYIFDAPGSFNPFVGIHLLKDEISPFATTGVYGRVGVLYSPDPYYGGVSIGFNIGQTNYSFNNRDIAFLDENDPLQNFEANNKSMTNLGLGMFYYKRIRRGSLKDDSYSIGISMPDILGMNELNITDEAIIQSRLNHSYFTVSYNKYVSESSFIEPQIWLKHVPNNKTHIDAITRYHHENTFWVGLGYSTSSTAHFEVGYMIGAKNGKSNNIKIGYGYDIGTAQYLNQLGGAHEINISYSMDTIKERKTFK